MLTMIIIITTVALASATRHACDEDAARALKRPWAPVVFHGDRETESLPEIDARFTPDGDADEAAGFRAVDDFNLGRQTAFDRRGFRRGRRSSQPLLAAPRGALPALRRSDGDVFIENAGNADGPARVKILGVVSADCH